MNVKNFKEILLNTGLITQQEFEKMSVEQAYVRIYDEIKLLVNLRNRLLDFLNLDRSAGK